jgi:hypothetical protein
VDTLEVLAKLAIAGAALHMYGAILIIGTFTIVATGAAVFLFVYYRLKRRFTSRAPA